MRRDIRGGSAVCVWCGSRRCRCERRPRRPVVRDRSADDLPLVRVSPRGGSEGGQLHGRDDRVAS